ncbi:putative reverse transcriptase domain-containing protein, partial [Tanacetum coccineum]
MVTLEARMIERYIGGLSQNIRGNVTSLKPTDIHETITMAQSLMDQVVQDLGEKTVDNKRKWEGNHNNNYNQNKRQEVAKVYTVGPNDKGKYVGNLPHCKLGSFDVIIGLDWLSEYQAVIACHEKQVHIPYGNEVMVVQGVRSEVRSESRLRIISYINTQKYIDKGCLVFLIQVTEKGTEEKQLKDLPIVRDFPKVFPEDLPGLPPTLQVEFQIDLAPRAAPVAHAPYRLAPAKMKELSDQLKELSDKG